MPGETSGVEHRDVNLYNVLRVMGGRLIDAEFEFCLTEEAHLKFLDAMQDVYDRLQTREGSFVLQFSNTASFDGPLEKGSIVGLAFQYRFDIDEEGDMGAESEGYYVSTYPDNIELPVDPNLIPVYEFDWDDIQWTRGYRILLDEPTDVAGLPLFN